ncbi:hypothetical protein BDB00DRAFT_409534 [Zychaea mexicana]|uniref:uncharacterized protein n=1 Tax=Zychaea mexicana TaxID=64656 RepID=UPI0022FDD793|nr:uncharacterized protein BDB00DRAFT_409534 [Zychaea mexicana]KAI9492966.1 hypothetical protein BDB00DRAFT_409534 [Zychaea mexicana]
MYVVKSSSFHRRSDNAIVKLALLVDASDKTNTLLADTTRLAIGLTLSCTLALCHRCIAVESDGARTLVQSRKPAVDGARLVPPILVFTAVVEGLTGLRAWLVGAGPCVCLLGLDPLKISPLGLGFLGAFCELLRHGFVLAPGLALTFLLGKFSWAGHGEGQAEK